MNIYLICTGNTCRSPMAEAILRTKKIDGLAVRSAGIHAMDGYPIASHAKTLIEEANLPYTAHSRALSLEDVNWAQLIFTMTETHKQMLLHTFPMAENKIFTLKEFVQPESSPDVHDPFGGNLETYRHTFDELAALMDMLEQKLKD